MKDYQKHDRAIVNALKRISSVTVTACSNNKRCILSINCKFLIKMISFLLFDTQVWACFVLLCLIIQVLQIKEADFFLIFLINAFFGLI